MLNTAILLITGITQLGLISAVFRAYNYDYESHQDRLNVLSTTVVLLAITSIPLTIVFILIASPLATLLLGNASFSAARKNGCRGRVNPKFLYTRTCLAACRESSHLLFDHLNC